MSKKVTLLIILIACFFLPLAALAKPQIVINMTSEKEVVQHVDGKEIRKIVPAAKVEPGQILIFTLKFTNTGDEKATNVVIKNPIPRDTIYLTGSATGENPLFSVDGGQTFKNPSLLKYETTGTDGRSTSKVASPEEYTDIRWTIPEVPPGMSGRVSFRAKVK